jgi:hypothetical protein
VIEGTVPVYPVPSMSQPAAPILPVPQMPPPAKPNVGIQMPALGPIGLALDLDVPLNRAPGDQKQIFNFSIGLFGSANEETVPLMPQPAKPELPAPQMPQPVAPSTSSAPTKPYVPFSTIWPVKYASDPNVRMQQLLYQSEDLRRMNNEWRKYWFTDQPSHLTPERVHGGIY